MSEFGGTCPCCGQPIRRSFATPLRSHSKPTVTVDRLDARSGERRSQQHQDVKESSSSSSSSYSIKLIERRRDTMVFKIDGALQVVETRTGKVVSRWP